MNPTDLDYIQELIKMNFETLANIANQLKWENTRLQKENQILQTELSSLQADYESALSNLHSYRK